MDVCICCWLHQLLSVIVFLFPYLLNLLGLSHCRMFFLSRALSTAALKLGCMLLGPYKYVFVVDVVISHHIGDNLVPIIPFC